jgi:hypothetical protein
MVDCGMGLRVRMGGVTRWDGRGERREGSTECIICMHTPASTAFGQYRCMDGIKDPSFRTTYVQQYSISIFFRITTHAQS